MTNQIQGEVLFGGWAGTAGDSTTWVYTPWQPVRGTTGTFGVQILQTSGISLIWCVETRTSEEATSTDLFTPTSSSGVNTFTTTNTVSTKEMYRYRFATTSTSNVTDWVHFRALTPSWNTDRA